MMGKRILYIGGFELPDKNAAAQRVLSNAKLLREMGYEVVFAGVSKDIANAPNEVSGFKSCPVPYPTNTKQWIHQVCTFIGNDRLAQIKPDYVVLYNFPAIASLRILKWCHKYGVKVIHDLTEWEANYGWSPSDIVRKLDINLRMRYCMRRMDGVIAISRYLYDYYKDAVKTIIVPPTVDIDDAKWDRGRLLKTQKPVSLVYAGSPGAGTKDRLDKIVDAVRNNPNVSLVVVGITDEQYRNAYHKDSVMPYNIAFKGRLPHVEAVRAVCNADFQMLIRNHNRKNDAGFPTKLVESMTCGTPVIATVFSNITDYLKDGYNGFLIDGDQNLEAVIDRVSNLGSEDILDMKRNCLNMREFDYRYYKTEFEKIFV